MKDIVFQNCDFSILENVHIYRPLWKIVFYSWTQLYALFIIVMRTEIKYENRFRLIRIRWNNVA